MESTKLIKVLAVLGVLMVGCERSDRFVRVANESLPKSCSVFCTGFLDDPETLERRSAGVLGSGVFVSTRGHILTCAHVILALEDGDTTITSFAGWTYRADIIAIDESKDLALLQINEVTPCVQIASEVKIGQEVIAIGQPLGLDFTVSHGIISRINTTTDLGKLTTQSDAFINPGNSGGPLFNLKGELVGINSFIVPPVQAPIFTGLGFSANPAEIKAFLKKEGIGELQ